MEFTRRNEAEMQLPHDLRGLIRESQSAKYLPVSDSSELLIVFSQRAPGYNQPKRFSYSSEIVEPRFNRLLLRDMNGLWYHGGLDKLGNSLRESIEFLRRVIEEGGFGSVFILGLSSGSHAAFVAGTKIPVDAVICVGCRFDLSMATREQNVKKGHEKYAKMKTLWTDPQIDRRYLNARDAAKEPGAAKSPVRLYYDPENRADTFHAGFVEDLPYVSSIHCHGYGHDVNRLSAEVFRSDTLLAGSAKFLNRTERLDRKKLAAGSKLASAVHARQGAG